MTKNFVYTGFRGTTGLFIASKMITDDFGRVRLLDDQDNPVAIIYLNPGDSVAESGAVVK